MSRENRGEWFGMRYLLSAIPILWIPPAKFDIFQDEKKTDKKTVSVPQSQILAGVKTLGLVGLWATFEGSVSMFWGAKKF